MVSAALDGALWDALWLNMHCHTRVLDGLFRGRNPRDKEEHMTGKHRSMFDPLHAGLALAVVALLGAALLGGCAAKQETMQMPPPGGPPAQTGTPPPGGPPAQMGMPPPGGPPPQESYPIMEQVAQRVIAHYQTSSCQALAQQKSQPPTGQQAQMEQRAMQILWNDPQMRTAFLNRVAAPIANKLFECDMIP
jgi:hypothetical protein